jgi:hypothetical protein
VPSAVTRRATGSAGSTARVSRQGSAVSAGSAGGVSVGNADGVSAGSADRVSGGAAAARLAAVTTGSTCWCSAMACA